MTQVRNKKSAIVGYMGYVPSIQDQDNINNPTQGEAHIPGYVGYIPAVKSQNLYAKTYGKITQNCAKGSYHRGIELPNQVKYCSTTKETYVHPNILKETQLQEGKISGVKLSTFSNAAKWIVDSSGKKQFQPQKLSGLTYEEACKRAFK